EAECRTSETEDDGARYGDGLVSIDVSARSRIAGQLDAREVRQSKRARSERHGKSMCGTSHVGAALQRTQIRVASQAPLFNSAAESASAFVTRSQRRSSMPLLAFGLIEDGCGDRVVARGARGTPQHPLSGGDEEGACDAGETAQNDEQGHHDGS